MSTSQPWSESRILTRYLLQSSSLPSIIPYNTFLSLLPSNITSLLSSSSSTNDQRISHALSKAIRKLYNDLQFQRNVTLDVIASNIERECSRSITLKAKLSQALQRELGVQSTHGIKRKRDEEESPEIQATPQLPDAPKHRTEQDENSEAEENSQSSDEERAHQHATRSKAPANSNADTTKELQIKQEEYNPLLDHREAQIDVHLTGHRGLSAPSTSIRYHTSSSLLNSMSKAVQNLETEITDLDDESEAVLKNLEETVGALSDLRYGKFSRVSGAQDQDGGLEGSVAGALRELTNLANTKVKTTKKG